MEKNKNTEPEQPIENIPAEGEGEQSKIPPSRKATTTLEENILPEAEDNITNEQLSTNYSQLTTDQEMEVHHHTHPGHHKKKWTDYFWEFLMLFLAVFCGFLAEYQLEHKIERDKEKVYVQNLLDDVKSDTAIYNQFSKSNKELFSSIDTLILLINRPDRKQHTAKLAFTARMILPKYKALYTTNRTYEEMKSSGTLRLIRNKQVANSVSHYYYSVIDLKKYNDAAFTWGSDFGKEMGKIFDAGLLLKIIKEKKEQPAVSSDLLTENRTALNELATTAQYLYGAFLLAEKIGNERNIAAQKLIVLIEKEYHQK